MQQDASCLLLNHRCNLTNLRHTNIHTCYHKHVHHTHTHRHTHTQSGTGVCYRDWSVFMLTRIPRRKCETETEQEDSNKAWMSSCIDSRRHATWLHATHTHTHAACMRQVSVRCLHSQLACFAWQTKTFAARFGCCSCWCCHIDTLQVCLAIVLTVPLLLLLLTFVARFVYAVK